MFYSFDSFFQEPSSEKDIKTQGSFKEIIFVTDIKILNDLFANLFDLKDVDSKEIAKDSIEKSNIKKSILPLKISHVTLKSGQHEIGIFLMHFSIKHQESRKH